MNSLRAALHKSCEHQVASSVMHQVNRLRSAGFPDGTIVSVAESLISEVKQARPTTGLSEQARQVRPVPVPYMHRVSHRLKKAALKCGVSVVFTAPRKLSGMCRMVNATEGARACGKKHVTRFVECSVAVVYMIPLSCGKCYIGQTGRCLNDRLREHRASVSAVAAAGHLADHCRRCACKAQFHCARVLRRLRGQSDREIYEAFCIKKAGDRCVSAPSLALSNKECACLDRGLRVEPLDWLSRDSSAWGV